MLVSALLCPSWGTAPTMRLQCLEDLLSGIASSMPPSELHQDALHS